MQSEKLLFFSMRRKAKLQGMTPEALEFVAARFRVLSEASRLKLILALEEGEKNVTGLVETTGLTQANVSRHLQTLTGAGILGRRKEGPNVIYYVADESIFELCDHVCSSLQRRLAGRPGRLRETGKKSSFSRLSYERISGWLLGSCQFLGHGCFVWCTEFYLAY